MHAVPEIETRKMKSKLFVFVSCVDFHFVLSTVWTKLCFCPRGAFVSGDFAATQVQERTTQYA